MLRGRASSLVCGERTKKRRMYSMSQAWLSRGARVHGPWQKHPPLGSFSCPDVFCRSMRSFSSLRTSWLFAGVSWPPFLCCLPFAAGGAGCLGFAGILSEIQAVPDMSNVDGDLRLMLDGGSGTLWSAALAAAMAGGSDGAIVEDVREGGERASVLAGAYGRRVISIVPAEGAHGRACWIQRPSQTTLSLVHQPSRAANACTPASTSSPAYTQSLPRAACLRRHRPSTPASLFQRTTRDLRRQAQPPPIHFSAKRQVVQRAPTALRPDCLIVSRNASSVQRAVPHSEPPVRAQTLHAGHQQNGTYPVSPAPPALHTVSAPHTSLRGEARPGDRLRRRARRAFHPAHAQWPATDTIAEICPAPRAHVLPTQPAMRACVHCAAPLRASCGGCV